jgi:hypothetical protein
MRSVVGAFLLTVLSISGSSSSLVIPQESGAITEISIEATRGTKSSGETYGRAFKIILRRHGTSSFYGKADVKLIGEYQSTFPREDFDKLADFLADRKYSQIKSNWLWTTGIRGGSINSPAIIASTVIVSVQTNEKRKTIRRASSDLDFNDENTETRGKVPIELLDIEAAITDAAMRLRWVKVRG